ncbi:MAG TPA: metalloregulator ArsR/SmtB family transcription factor [Kiloniellales bacterium]|nr:metalloregulator ArsR/SmtB family transcription factor [Kiloniellales bacterium]
MPNQSTALDRIYRALSDPTRRAVIQRLSRGPATVSEIAKPFRMSLPSVVQHLQVLEESGLIKTRKAGRVRTCRIVPKALISAEEWIAHQRALWEGRLDRLEAYLKDLQAKGVEHGDG